MRTTSGFRQVSEAGLKFTMIEEGRVPFVYDDAVGAKRYTKGKVLGTLTGGYGHTGADLQAYIGKSIPENVMHDWLDKDMDAAEQAVSSLVKVPLNDNQFDCMADFVYNAGVAGFQGSTLLKKLNQGKYDAVPALLSAWVYTTIGGKKVRSAGLVKRRADEALLFMRPMSINDTKLVPFTPAPHADDEPTGTPVAAPKTPDVISVESVSTVAGIFSTIVGSVTSGPIAYVVAGGAALAFAIAAYWFVTKRLFPR